ncbi:MAG: diaminopimelate epimerase [Bacillota bacterium]|nr:diaminopimelate epimerase [Bacillota bacterium]
MASAIPVRAYNGDGSAAAFCANGLLCLAKYALDAGLLRDGLFYAETDAGAMAVRLLDARPDQITAEVSLGPAPPVRSLLLNPVQLLPHLNALPGDSTNVCFTEPGVPHCVVFPEPLRPHLRSRRDLREQLAFLEERAQRDGPWLSRHPAFPEGANVDFVLLPSPSPELLLVPWERGVGLTPASGSGACAAALAARHMGLEAAAYAVAMPGGSLTVSIDSGNHLFLRGSASLICAGALSPGFPGAART